MDVALFCVDHNEEHSLKNGFSEDCPDGQWVRGHSALGRNLSLVASTHRHQVVHTACDSNARGLHYTCTHEHTSTRQTYNLKTNIFLKGLTHYRKVECGLEREDMWADSLRRHEGQGYRGIMYLQKFFLWTYPDIHKNFSTYLDHLSLSFLCNKNLKFL